MPTQLETWERKHYAPGGGDPFLFYVVYGSVDPSARLFRGKYRSNGRPDISVHNVPGRLEGPVVDLVNRLIEQQAFGHVVPDGQEVRMASLPPGGLIRHRGHLDDPDFNNIHLDVSWPDTE